MAQQVFPQWSPVVKAHNENQQEVYIPAAIIHAQTRDGKDELIVGAANMQFDPETGDYLPTHAGNPVEVRARALETLLQTLGKEETLALVKAALDALVSKDFATQTTLAAVLAKLADLATESTLDGLKSAVDALAGTVDAGAQKVTLTGHTVDMATESTLSSLASAVAKETTLAQVLSALGALATETTLGGVKTAVDVLAGTVDTQAGVQKVALSGRDVQPSIMTFDPVLTDWTPGQSRVTPVVDLSAAPGVYAISIAVDSDQPIEVNGLFAPGGGTAPIPTGSHSTIRMRAVLMPSTASGLAEYIPAFRPLGGRYALNLINRGDGIPTRCRVYTYHWQDAFPQPQNMRALIARALAIRDTNLHYAETDPNNVYTIMRFVWGGGKVPIYIANSLDQSVDVSVVLRLGGVFNMFEIGTKAVPAGGATVITNQDFAGIDVPSETIDVRFKCSTAPTTGQVNAWIDTLVGGSA